MPPKRKREDDRSSDSVVRPVAGTRTFVSGQAVKEGLASGSRQALVSFHQQIHTYQSKLPLPISNPTVTIIQHYLDVSPVCEEILNAWKEGDRTRNDRLVESAVALLGMIVNVLRPLPFFRTTLVNLVNKILTPSEAFSDSINRQLQSERRDLIQATLSFVAAVVNLDPPAIGINQGSGGRLATKIWSTLSDGGSVKGMGKMFGMRIRNQEGKPLYDSHDPYDRADIRHLALQTVLPLLAVPNVYSYARTLMPPIYSHMDQDPPITIFRILSAIWDVVTQSSAGTSRRISLALINESSVDSLLKVLGRMDYDPISGQKVGDIVKGFIEAVTTTPGRGLCFTDDGWYPRQIDNKGNDEDEVRGNREDREKQKLHNRVLANIIRKLGARVIDDDGRLGDIVTKIVKACPELVAGYWAHSALAVDPKMDIRWMATMAFIGRIVSLPPPPFSTFRQPSPRGSDAKMPIRTDPPAVSTIIESILPSPMHKNHLTRGLQHPDSLVRHVTATTLARSLQKLQVVQQLLAEIAAEAEAAPSSSREGSWTKVHRELELEARRRVPEVIVVIGFAQQSAQIAPAEAETDEEKALLAKSTMLTESALRLFGLYYRTLPSLSSEARFDVGRLLVSSSSAKAEKRERKMLKSGSVADDSGSVASIGTAGTAGMGGGFGYARGEVEGFDALSQVHVLALLRDVKEWDWARKAAASQYTYLYHILQLHLNTQLSVTTDLSASLIENILRPTLLFEHDPSEISIWISALPRAHATISGPLLTVQQLYLLSFLDDCFRRAQSLPYRYIEQLTNLVPNYFSWSKSGRMVSCVLMAVLEQFHAKISGQHIATDAAIVVLGYLRRVLLGLMGKMDDDKFLGTVLSKLEDTYKAAREKGQERPGLETLIQAMRHDLDRVFGGQNDEVFSESTDFPRLVDEQQWRETSLESLLLHGANSNLASQTHSIVLSAVPAAATRQARFLVHLLARHPSTTLIVFERLEDCLGVTKGTDQHDIVKSIIFSPDSVKKFLLTDEGDTYRIPLSKLVAYLDPEESHDIALVEPVSERLLHLLKKSKKYNPLLTLELLSPWTRLSDAQSAEAAIDLLAKASTRLNGLTSSHQTTLSEIFQAPRSPSKPLSHLSTFLPLGVYSPFTDVLSSPNIFETTIDVQLDEAKIKALLDSEDGTAQQLITKLAEVVPSVCGLVSSILSAEPERLSSAALLPTVAQILGASEAVDIGDGEHRLILTALGALTDRSGAPSGAARSILCLVKDQTALSRLISEIDVQAFSVQHSSLAIDLAQSHGADASASIRHLVQLALRKIARACSDEKELDETSMRIITNTLTILRLMPELEVAVELVEPVITSIIGDRLHVEATVLLAARLAASITLQIKASFVRQHLQALLSSPALITLSETTSTPEARLPFVQLYSALFTASTYVSCQPNFVEPLVPLYRGTMSEADLVILDMFQLFESVRRVSIASVLRSWSSSGLTGTDKAFDAFTSLDPGKVNNTCASFPLRRSLGAGVPASDHNDRIYDPVFVLALFGATLMEKDLTGLEWVEVMRSGGLGIVVSALSSRDQRLREYANWLLSKTFSLISNTAFHERDQLLYTLRLIRHAIASPEKTNSFPRLPPLIALFLSYVVRAQATPSHFLYPITSRFLLQRPVLDTTDVPMLYSMLYASEDGWKNERAWIVRLLRDGVKSETDWRVIKRRHTWSLLATLYQCSLDIPFRRLVLQALASFIKVPAAVRSLVNRDCVLTWLGSQWQLSVASPNKAAAEEQGSILRIYQAIVESLVQMNDQRLIKSSNGIDKTNGDADILEHKQHAGSIRKENPAWLLDLEIFLQQAAIDADPDRLESLSRLLSAAAGVSLPVNAFLALADRTTKLSKTDQKLRIAGDLFEAGLYLAPDQPGIGYRLGKLQSTMTALKREITASPGELGRWARKETRVYVFQQAGDC